MISVHPLDPHALPALGAEGGNEAPTEALATPSDTAASLHLVSHTLKSMPLAAGGLLLASCGGGGSSGGGISFGPAQTDTEAARFLSQAGFSASTESMAAVRNLGLSDWLDSQLAMPVQGISRYEWMVSNGYAVEANRTNFTGADNAIWLKFMSSPDPVRQRMTLALSEIFVVSMQGLPIEWRGLCIADYADLLERHAFGTYRQLLQEVTLSVGMGSYLNMLGNRKEDTRTGRVPDENYAREVMQLFSIGGFDNHDFLLTQHPGLLGQLASGLSAFQSAMTELGLADQVTTFTASDFGRTLTSNGDGSDHGWGSHHLIMGGAVRGQRFWGKMPLLANNGPNDVGQGRLIPTSSVDQLAATLAKWMGVSATEIKTLFPNISRYNQSDLGFFSL